MVDKKKNLNKYKCPLQFFRCFTARKSVIDKKKTMLTLNATISVNMMRDDFIDIKALDTS